MLGGDADATLFKYTNALVRILAAGPLKKQVSLNHALQDGFKI